MSCRRRALRRRRLRISAEWLVLHERNAPVYVEHGRFMFHGAHADLEHRLRRVLRVEEISPIPKMRPHVSSRPMSSLGESAGTTVEACG